ncbi:MAG: dTMP kinase [Candidatus Limnocylindrales bacterium]
MGDPQQTGLRGWFITLEGPDGSGKTLVSSLLRDRLVARGSTVLLTREPGGTTLGDRVRSMVLDYAPSDPWLAPRADALLFAAGRAQHVAEVIEPGLARGEIVICARYADSSLAYQGYGLGLPLAEVRALQEFATGGRWPDLTVLLDLAVEAGLARKQRDEQTRFEAGFDTAYHERVRAGYLAMAAAEPGRWVVVDATAPVETVVERASAAIDRLVGRPTEPAGPPLRIHP